MKGSILRLIIHHLIKCNWLQISEREFVDGCLRDHELCTMLEGSIGAFAGPVAAAGFNIPANK